jgi:hypothetical protein
MFLWEIALLLRCIKDSPNYIDVWFDADQVWEVKAALIYQSRQRTKVQSIKLARLGGVDIGLRSPSI